MTMFPCKQHFILLLKLCVNDKCDNKNTYKVGVHLKTEKSNTVQLLKLPQTTYLRKAMWFTFTSSTTQKHFLFL